MEIKVYFMGSFRVFLNDEEIIISQNKLRAVLSYIFYKKVCTRAELIDIFWGDLNEAQARSNLRNALSRLKTLSKTEIISSDNQSVNINPIYTVYRDIDKILDQNNTSFLEFENYSFLDNHGVRACYEFDEWVSGIRSAYDQIIIKHMYYHLNNQINQNNRILIERIAKKIISIDSYNEEAYRSLMELYASRYEYKEAINLYKQLEDTLKNELDVDVDGETKKAYEKIKIAWSTKQSNSKDARFDRLNYISNIEYEYNNFKRKKKFKHCLIYGELGVGKTEIITKFIKDKESSAEICTIKLQLEQRKNKYSLVNKIIRTIDGARYERIHDFNSFQEYPKKFTKMEKDKIILIKDMQYADMESLEILQDFLEMMDGSSIFIILEYSTTLSQDIMMINYLLRNPFIKEIEVGNLTYDEFQLYIKSMNDYFNLGYKESYILEQKYDESCGNIMFVNESISNIIESDNKDKLERGNQRKKELYLTLNKEELYILQLLSASFNGLSFDFIEKNSKIITLDSLNVISNLESRGIIITRELNNQTLIDFKYPSIKTNVYKNTNISLMEHIHKLIMNYYEEKIYFHRDDYLNYFDILIFHSRMSKDYSKYLEYELKRIEYMLNYYDEFYPSIENYGNIEDIKRLNKKNIYDKFDDIEKLISNIVFMDEGQKNHFYLVLMFLKGRSLIRDGYCNEGQVFINNILENESLINDRELIIKCDLERIYYGLRIADAEIMLSTIKKIRSYNISNDLSLEGKVFRLEGLAYYIEGDYRRSIDTLYKAIDSYNRCYKKDYNVYGIAACYNYIGMVHRTIGELKKAKECHKTAINLCEKRELYKPLDEFYKDYAYAVFIDEEYELAKELCITSNGYYESHASFWDRSIVENILSLIYLREKDNLKAVQHHRSAEILISKSPTKRELELHNQVSEIITR